MRNIVILSVITLIFMSCNGNVAKPMKGYRWCWACNGHQKLSNGETCLTCKGTGTLTDKEYVITKSAFEFYQDIKKEAENKGESDESSSSSIPVKVNSGYDQNQNYNSYSSSGDIESAPSRTPCRACHSTGLCSCARDGHPGQILSNYTSSGEPIFMRCSYCNGTGQHLGCGGDGYLDYGVDY